MKVFILFVTACIVNCFTIEKLQNRLLSCKLSEVTKRNTATLTLYARGRISLIAGTGNVTNEKPTKSLLLRRKMLSKPKISPISSDDIDIDTESSPLSASKEFTESKKSSRIANEDISSLLDFDDSVFDNKASDSKNRRVTSTIPSNENSSIRRRTSIPKNYEDQSTNSKVFNNDRIRDRRSEYSNEEASDDQDGSDQKNSYSIEDISKVFSRGQAVDANIFSFGPLGASVRVTTRKETVGSSTTLGQTNDLNNGWGKETAEDTDRFDEDKSTVGFGLILRQELEYWEALTGKEPQRGDVLPAYVQKVRIC